MLSQGVDASDLPKLYRCPFDTTKEAKLVMFQFKINHNIVYTKDKLMKAKMSTTNTCYLCNFSVHTLQHMLVDCPVTQRFWRSFRTWWFIMTKVNLNLCRVSILYGYFRPCKFKTLTNLALLVAKYFIYKCFLNEESLDFEVYKIQLREKATIEQLIASKNNTIAVFNKKWQPFISSNFISCSLTRHAFITLSRISIVIIS